MQGTTQNLKDFLSDPLVQESLERRGLRVDLDALVAVQQIFNPDDKERIVVQFHSVMNAIRSERDYQTDLPRANVRNQSPMEFLAIIQRICRDMEDAYYDGPGDPPMDYMRKIAAVAVRCMQQHGAPLREQVEPPKDDCPF